MQALLGDKLLGKSGDISTAEAVAGKKAIGLYFSAHWCPPCRGFTPKLAEWYTADLKAAGLEVIFVSSDNDEDTFNSYYGEQPWLALPYSDRDRKAALSKKFKVQGIPSFVILDADGNVITTDGRAAVTEDPKGSNLPWKSKTLQDILEGATLMKGADKISVKEAFADKKAVGFYFSAHWCPPCRGFTPKLAEWYKKDLQAKGLEVVFVSSDKDEAAYKDYYAEQPWLSVDFADKSMIAALSKTCKVEGIPHLAIIDPTDFSIITLEGRGAAQADPEGNDLPWLPKPISDLAAGPGAINETSTLLVFCETSSDGEKAAIEKALTPIGQRFLDKAKSTKEDAEMVFLTVKSEGDLATRIRGMTGLETAPSPAMVIVDIPDDGAYYVAEAGAITTESVEKFIADYKAKGLKRQQLK